VNKLSVGATSVRGLIFQKTLKRRQRTAYHCSGSNRISKRFGFVEHCRAQGVRG